MKSNCFAACGFLLLFVPWILLASSCSPAGATIVYVNGIETTQQQAKDDTALLRKIFIEYGGSSAIQFITGYNPSHLDGLGDEIESISQALNAPISDYDLNTILQEVASQITTQKLLLVGHSQGSFYTNEMYDYLVQHGMPPNSIAVLDLATPAGVVEGGGAYFTSANDKVINYVRQMDAQWGAHEALPANILIPPEPGYAGDMWGGHLPDVYFNGAGQQIAAGMNEALGKLSTSTVGSVNCFMPPADGLSYDAQTFAFSIADPLVAGTDYVAADTKNTLASVADNANDILHTAFSDAVFSVMPQPTAQNAAGAFAVEKAIYGSSLSVADYKALLNGQDIPQTEPEPTRDPSAEKSDAEASPAKTVPVNIAPVQPEQTPAQATKPPSAAIPIPQPVALDASPGFGGGSPAPSQTATQPSIVNTDPVGIGQQLQASASSTGTTDEESEDAATAVATTTATTSASDAGAQPQPASTSTESQFGQSPVSDHFDSDDLSSWTGIADGVFQFDATSSDCLANGCIVNTALNALTGMYKIGTPTSAGTAVLYFRNYGYQAQISFDICNDAGCGEGKWAGVYTTPAPIYSTSWHYWFLAWKEGTTDEQICWLTDETNLSDCSWNDSGFPSGTYDGVVISQNAGMSRGAAIYFDELGSATYVSQ